jgi:N-acetylglucosaminyldiphosphoundecaprenol N-acetyl-beta-D-mannosaminyltransferase
MQSESKPNQTAQLLGVAISKCDLPNAMGLLRTWIERGAGGYLCFSNVHTVTESQWNLGLRNALNGAKLAVADGVPLLWLARCLGDPIQGRVCGPDFMRELIRLDPEMVHGLIGGAPGVAQELVRKMGIRAVCYSPPMRPFSAENVQDDLDRFAETCARLSLTPRVVWVGLGAPKQELWMSVAAGIRTDLLFLGVGAAFDFLSEKKSRAPVWMQNLGLEWLFRLIQEPRRLARRYLVTNSLFVAYSVRAVLATRLRQMWRSIAS